MGYRLLYSMKLLAAKFDLSKATSAIAVYGCSKLKNQAYWTYQ